MSTIKSDNPEGVDTDNKNEHYMTLKSDIRETSILGVFTKDEGDDIDLLVNHFSAPALARALREREAILQMVAKLVNNKHYEDAEELLLPYQEVSIRKRRMRNGEKPIFNAQQPLNKNSLIMIQRALQRRPRQVYQGSEKRASVVIPLCNVNGIASVLFQRRSATVSTYKNQVCFPGGMVDDDDKYIVETSLRELYEELAIHPEQTEVLGILRCNWTEVKNITGIAVTPVVGYMGEYSALDIQPNKDEVDELFTVPLHVLMDESHWELKPNAAPVFHGNV